MSNTFRSEPPISRSALALTHTPDAATLALFEEILSKGAGLRVRVTGRSMAPFLRGGEVVTIRKMPCASLRRGDIIFFRSPDGLSKIHRVVRRFGGGRSLVFQTSGDALAVLDPPVGPENVLGKVCIIERPGTAGRVRRIDLESRRRRAVNGLIALASLGIAATCSGLMRIVGNAPPHRLPVS